MAIVPLTPPIVLDLIEQGCFAQPTTAGTQFSIEEGTTLLQHYVHLLRLATPEANDALAETYHAVGDASLARHGPPPEQPLACKKGCSHCCYQHVSVSAVEVFAIARHVRASAGLDATVARLDAKYTKSSWDPARVLADRSACAFLVSGACGIHAFRPMICRILVSFDSGACLRQLANGHGKIPHPVSIVAIRGWLTSASWSALQAAGLPLRDYELSAAVRAVLADPGIEARWYAGDDGLAHVSSDAETPDPAMLAEIAQWRAMAAV